MCPPKIKRKNCTLIIWCHFTREVGDSCHVRFRIPSRNHIHWTIGAWLVIDWFGDLLHISPVTKSKSNSQNQFYLLIIFVTDNFRDRIISWQIIFVTGQFSWPGTLSTNFLDNCYLTGSQISSNISPVTQSKSNSQNQFYLNNFRDLTPPEFADNRHQWSYRSRISETGELWPTDF